MIPTSLVGSYAQPNWLIDRERLRERFPPRVRARELWRVDPALPRGGPGRRDAAGDRRPGARRARHRHRRRDAPRELLEPLRHRARGRRHRQPGHGARPQRASQPGAAGGRPGRPPPSGAGARPGVPARAHEPHDEDHGAGAVHDVPAGPGRLLRRAGQARAWRTRRRCAARSSTCSRPAPTSSRSTSPTCRRAPSRRASTASTSCSHATDGIDGTTAVHICFGYAAIIHERPSGYSFLPELAATECDQISIETAQSGPRARRARLAAGRRRSSSACSTSRPTRSRRRRRSPSGSAARSRTPGPSG